MNLVIRADADHEIGMGHVMRCLALARMWQMEGGKAIMLSKSENASVRHLVETSGLRYIPLQDRFPGPADLKETLLLLDKLQADWAVLDGYHFDPAFQRALKGAGHNLLIIDDNGHWPEYHAHILLNQNIKASQVKYRCDPGTTLLLGPKHVLLRPEFLNWHNYSREIPRVARRLLVTLGGGDPNNVTLKVAQALQEMDENDLESKVVVGQTNYHLETLLKTIKDFPENFQTLTNVTNMPELMAWADLAISAGGSTCWELSFMGVPNIVMVLAENQRRNAEGLEEAGMALNLGWFDDVSVKAIGAAINYLSNSYQLRHSMSQAGRELIDGRGSQRVVKRMIGNAIDPCPCGAQRRKKIYLPLTLAKREAKTLSVIEEGGDVPSLGKGGQEGIGHTRMDDSGMLKVRPARMQDVTSLWQLANDPAVRENSFHPEPIAFETHREWYRHKLSFEGTRIWILELNERIVAQVRYDRLDADSAEIGYSVRPEYRGRGFGAKALVLTAAAACKQLGVKSLRGLVFDSNLPSIRAFTKAGFKQIDKFQENKDRPCTIFEWSFRGRTKC